MANAPEMANAIPTDRTTTIPTGHISTRFRALVDAAPFLPSSTRTHFDAALPTLVLADEDDVGVPALPPLPHPATIRNTMRAVAASMLPTVRPTARAGYRVAAWPVAIAVDVERAVVAAAAATAAPSVGALTPAAYEAHYAALLIADAVGHRLAVASRDVCALRVVLAQGGGGGGGGDEGWTGDDRGAGDEMEGDAGGGRRGAGEPTDGAAQAEGALRIAADGLVHVEVHVPGLPDGAPSLTRGSLVRIRESTPGVPAASPWGQPFAGGGPPAPAIRYPLEVEAAVASTNIARSTAVLRLPSRIVTRSCLLCGPQPWRAGAAAVAPDAGGGAPTIMGVPCGHQVMCARHALSLTMCSLPRPPACPFCAAACTRLVDVAAPGAAAAVWGPGGRPPPNALLAWLTTRPLHVRFEPPLTALPPLLRALDAVRVAAAVDAVVDAESRLQPGGGGGGAFGALLSRLFPATVTRGAPAALWPRFCGRGGSGAGAGSLHVAGGGAPPPDWLNAEQRAAVAAIASGAHGTTPYLLLGPAGCGKTATMVEAVLQVLRDKAAAAAAAAAPVPTAAAAAATAAPAGTRALRAYAAAAAAAAAASTAAPVPRPSGRVLIVAPSDEAADLVLSALHDQSAAIAALRLRPPPAAGGGDEREASGGGGLILRFNLPSRRPEALAPRLHRYAFMDPGTGLFLFPPQAALDAAAVIVASTEGATGLARYAELSAAGGLTLARWRLHDDGAHDGAWVDAGAADAELAAVRLHATAAAVRLRLSHLFFDEASQASEPDALLPLLLCNAETRVVLAGDPRQLGPVVHSAIARARGLAVSLQERLLRVEVDTRARPAATPGGGGGSTLGRAEAGHAAAHLAPSPDAAVSARSPLSQPSSPLASASAGTSSLSASPAALGAPQPLGALSPLGASLLPTTLPRLESAVFQAMRDAAGDAPGSGATVAASGAGSLGASAGAWSAPWIDDDAGATSPVSSSPARLYGGGADGDHSLCTSLGVNYRSHPALLDIPSRIFYGGALVSRAPAILTAAAASFSLLARWTAAALRHGGGGARALDGHVVAGDPAGGVGAALPALSGADGPDADGAGDDADVRRGAEGTSAATRSSGGGGVPLLGRGGARAPAPLRDVEASALAADPPAAPGAAAVPPGFPLLAIGVRGDDAHKLDSPSFWNDAEVDAVVWVVRYLLSESGGAAAPGAAAVGAGARRWPRPPPRPVYVQGMPGSGVVDLPSPQGLEALWAARGVPWAAAVSYDAPPPLRLSQGDIGVIAAYRQQVLRIRDELRRVGLGQVSVGVVDNFQGAGKAAIVVSTVLSRNYGGMALAAATAATAAVAAAACGGEGAPPARAHTTTPLTPSPFTSTVPGGRFSALGLFGDGKTFNVALTRAEALLVVVGDPAVWAAEPRYWRPLLERALEHGAYVGWGGLPPPIAPSPAAALWLPGA